MKDSCDNCKFSRNWMHQYSCISYNKTWWCGCYEPTLERKLKRTTEKYLRAVRKYVEFGKKFKKPGK